MSKKDGKGALFTPCCCGRLEVLKLSRRGVPRCGRCLCEAEEKGIERRTLPQALMFAVSFPLSARFNALLLAPGVPLKVLNFRRQKDAASRAAAALELHIDIGVRARALHI